MARGCHLVATCCYDEKEWTEQWPGRLRLTSGCKCLRCLVPLSSQARPQREGEWPMLNFSPEATGKLCQVPTP